LHSHPGNKRLRLIVNKYRGTYQQAKKLDKPNVSKLIVSALRSAVPPSRFLRMNEETTLWEDVGDKRAAEKVSQRLRERARGDERQSTAIQEGLFVPAAIATQGAPESTMFVAATHTVFQRAADETQMAQAGDMQAPEMTREEDVQVPDVAHADNTLVPEMARVNDVQLPPEMAHSENGQVPEMAPVKGVQVQRAHAGEAQNPGMSHARDVQVPEMAPVENVPVPVPSPERVSIEI
jgi:hypothetical protein